MTAPTSALRPGQRICPGRCGRSIPARLLACSGCTSRLPTDLRALINHAPTGPAPRDREHRAHVALAVRDWLLEYPSPRDPDASIAGVCEHCDAELLWLTTAAGRRMPVNAAPDPERGNVVRTGPAAGVLGDQAATAARSAGTSLWLHHAASCPHADRWQGARRKARR